jgi:hypothetical protein
MFCGMQDAIVMRKQQKARTGTFACLRERRSSPFPSGTVANWCQLLSTYALMTPSPLVVVAIHTPHLLLHTMVNTVLCTRNCYGRPFTMSNKVTNCGYGPWEGYTFLESPSFIWFCMWVCVEESIGSSLHDCPAGRQTILFRAMA